MASATYRINGEFDGKPLEKMKTALSAVADKAKAVGAAVGAKVVGAFAAIKGVLASTAIEIVRNSEAFRSISAKVSELGGSIKKAMSMSISKMLAPITDKFSAAFDRVRNKIINIFYHFPEAAKAAFDSAKEMLERTFSVDGLKNLFAHIFKGFFLIAKAQIENVADFLKTSFRNVTLILESLFGKPFVKLENAIAKAGNFLISVVDKALSLIWRNAPNWLKKLFDLLGVDASDGPKIDFRFSLKDENADTGTLKGAIDKGLQNMKDFALRSARRDAAAGESLADNLKAFGEFYGAETGEFLSKMKEIMGRELPAELREAVESAASPGQGASAAEKTNWLQEFSQVIGGLQGELQNKWGAYSQRTQNRLAKIDRDLQDGAIDTVQAVDAVNGTLRHAHLDALGSALGDSLAGLGGELGRTVQAIAQGASQGGPWGAILSVIVQAFERIASKISEVSPSFEKFTNFIDTITDGAMRLIDMDLVEGFVQPLVEIFGKIGEVFGTVTNVVFELLAALSPLLNIVSRIIGAIAKVLQCVGAILRVLINVLAPILKILAPILNLICGALNFVADIFKYVAKLIINVYAFVANAIARCVNAVIDLLNCLPFVDIDHVGYIDADKMFNDLFQENTFEQENEQNNSAEYKTSAANYTAARDIYMNVYYQNSYINGDARAIALSIRDEIRRAEKLGY